MKLSLKCHREMPFSPKTIFISNGRLVDEDKSVMKKMDGEFLTIRETKSPKIAW